MVEATMSQPDTTDLVARLRAPEQWRSFPDPDDEAPREAADEIERLRSDLAAANTRIIYLETELCT